PSSTLFPYTTLFRSLAGGCLRPTRPPLRTLRPTEYTGFAPRRPPGRGLLHLLEIWRRGRDSNPRSLAGFRFSRPAPSTGLGHPSDRKSTRLNSSHVS